MMSGICMHIPEVRCPNCAPGREWPQRSFPAEPPPVVDQVRFGVCAYGHDYAVGESYAVCNRCDRVVDLESAIEGQ